MASERLDAASRLAGWIAHQINNPLGAISGNAQLLARRLQRDIGDQDVLRAYLDYLDTVQAQTERCARITAEALNFTQIGEPRMTKVDVSDVISDAVELARYARPESHVNFAGSPSSKQMDARADREWLTRVVFEVLSNAVQASGGEGVVEVITAHRVPRLVEIVVSDSGTGIADEALPRVFDPFFSTRESARGLGLTLSLDMMRRMNGSLAISKSDSRGTVVVIRIPAWGRTD